jgi:hypothetical protein
MHHFTKYWLTALFSAITLIFASPPMDAAITINNVTGVWSSVTGGNNVSGKGTSLISWGDTKGLRSAYQFIGNAPPSFSANEGQVFNIGTFTHYNYPIPVATGINGARLSLNLSLTIGSTTIDNIALNYDFHHNETLNARPCTTGSVSICDDIVTLLNNSPLSTVLVFDGVAYDIKILGFQVGQDTISQLYTKENYTNNAVLRAVITPVPIPEPTTYMILGSFLVALTMTRLMKKRKLDKCGINDS